MQRLQHAGDEEARVEYDGLARLEVHLHVVCLPQPAHNADQPLNVVILPRDVVTAAQVEPLHPRKIRTELFLERGHRLLERVGILFAERVKVQAVKEGQNALVKVGKRRTEA